MESMKSINVSRRLSVLVPLLLCLQQGVRAQDTLHEVLPPDNYGTMPLSVALEPTTNPYGTAGMSNVVSAEPLGAGRIGMQLRGNFYQQNEAFPGTPVDKAQVTTLTLGTALGLNPYIDGFVGADAYNLRGGGTSTSGLGTTYLGAQGTLPLPDNVPVRLGLQVMTLFGTSSNQINTTPTTTGDAGAYGYNYLETRRYTDLSAKLTQSLLFVGNDMGLKIHFNEGVISSFQPDKGVLLVTGVGLQYFVIPPLVLGVEANDRTFLSDPKASDPFWITPSVVFRTPAHLNIEAGADISATKSQPDGTQTLTPWRGFIAVSLSYDTQAEMKRREAEQARQRMLQDQALAAQARQAEMAKDSLAKAAADSVARAKAVEDSMAVKAHQDSIALAATQGALNEEISKRSDEEKQLLSTGLLVMDAVYFQTGKTDISINSYPYLKLIAKMLTKYPKLQIEVAGNTDNVGGYDYNMGLSQGRSEAVMNYMIQVAPDLSGRLTAKGYGYTQPKASNSTAAGRKLNRRTELRVTNKEALKEYNP